MERHQHAMYKFCPIRGRFGHMLLTNRSFSQQAWWFLVGNVSPSGTKRYPLPLISLKFFSHVNIEQQECCVIFHGSFGHFYALTEFSMNFMCTIQIWTTCTSSVHINWLKNQICVLGCMLRSHARNGNEFQTPGHRRLPAKRWDTLFLNSSKSKTHLKFMKLGMLSWSGINMQW